MNKEYAVYKGDEFIMIGNMFEIMEKLEISKNNFYCLKSPSQHSRAKEGFTLIYEIEDE